MIIKEKPGKLDLIGDLHIHSKYSYDSLMEPRKILKFCKRLGYNIISITDHDCITGALEAKKYEKEFGINVIIGEEIKTDAGDIIGLNINEKLKSFEWTEVLDEIKGQDGISVFPHPFRGHKNIEDIANKADLIEIRNSHSKLNDDIKASDLALKLNKPPVVGSDAHISSEIGNAIMRFNDLFDSGKQFTFKYSKKYQKSISHIVKDIKLYKFHKIPLHLLRALF